ncbi:GGDEF domain-containing protein [Archangium sp.]|uniref:GGDEF domain-containing protein n=1 Tax=Archangium sp. TaxID=1872627 RepID=UPI002D5DDAEC|nr:GGDEF domain-containing protein [Archangium sp.]HYO52295.1 GGDEF domain-containing protein [Archangium sp.]
MTEHAPQVCPLTGAYLRPHFESLLARAVSDARMARMPLTVLWVDVDETQEGNDAHGREAMDTALSGVVDELAAELDGRGPIGRMEGDAFAASLYAVTPDMGARLAEGLRRRLAGRSFHSGSGGFHLTVSVGVAGLRTGEPYGNFMEAAETACVQAKQAGRDQVVVR